MKELIKTIVNKITKNISHISPFFFEKEDIFGYKNLQGSYAMPVNYMSLSLDIQKSLLIKYNLKEVSVFKLNNVFVTAQGIIFKNLKVFISSLADATIDKALNYTFTLRQFTNSRKSFIAFEDTIIIAHDQWSQNYYHWMIDLLPRLLLLDAESKKLTLILPEFESEYMVATLKAIGYKNFYKLRDNSLIKAKSILLPERTAVGAFQNPYLLQELRLKLLKALSPDKIDCTRRVYVSRAKSQKRRLMNEQLILPILEKYRFEYIYFEDLNFFQQVELMQQTKVLVGVHGANFVNTLFMQKGTTVVEMMNSDFLNLVYYRMATALELNYYLIPCAESAASTAQSYHGPPLKNDIDLEVNPSLLEEALSSIF